MLDIILINIFLAICWYIFYKVKKTYAFFEEKGIPYVPATFPFGSDIKSALLLSHPTESLERLYQKLYKYKISGYFQYFRPVYLIKDPDYVKMVLINDFSYFYDKGVAVDEKVNPLDGSLFFLSGQKWRFLRQKLTPMFTTGKLRWMYEEMNKCADIFLNHFKRHDGKEVEIKDELGCFTTDVIGSTVFGLEIDSIKNPDSEFRKMGKRSFDLTLYESFIFFGRLFFPQFILKFKIKTLPDFLVNFYILILKKTLENRIETGIIRKDIIHLILELKQKGYVNVDVQDREELEQDNFETNSKDIEITDETLAAQAFVFFIAGFETTATTLNFTLYLLAKHPEYQEEVRAEVRQVKAKYGKIDFDGLKELPFLEKCISESLRLFPPVAFLNRQCTKDYTFPNGTKVEKGSFVLIPVHSLHHDPANFKDPEVFKPERFNEPPKPGTYAPFGDGPRICIAKRFALTEIKMLLAKMLDEYLIEKSELTEEPITYIPSSLLSIAKTKLYVKIKKL